MSKSFTFGEYTWFVGVVEDVDDPKQSGRVRVRVHGYHPDSKQQLPTESLPWALVSTSTMSSTQSGIGITPHMLQVKSHVLGFFLDGKDAQMPFVICTYMANPDGSPDVNKLARNENTVKKTLMSAGSIKEPASEFGAKYPHNKVMNTPSGHIIEIDDTPGKERLHVYHKSGTYIEFFPSGKVVFKTAGDSFELVNGNKSIIAKGNLNVEVTGNYTLNVGGSYTVKAGSSGNMNFGSSLNIKSGSSTNIQAGGSMSLKAGGIMSGKASLIRLN